MNGLPVTVFALLGLVMTGGAPGEDLPVERIRAVASTSASELPPGSQAILSLTLELIPGAHANSNRPADPQLVPTTFFPAASDQVRMGRARYPQPTQVIEWYSVDPLSVFVSGAVIQVPFTIADEAPAGETKIGGSLRVQVCDAEMCYPTERLPVDVRVTIVD